MARKFYILNRATGVEWGVSKIKSNAEKIAKSLSKETAHSFCVSPIKIKKGLSRLDRYKCFRRGKIIK